jgi:hypothetical protein
LKIISSCIRKERQWLILVEKDFSQCVRRFLLNLWSPVAFRRENEPQHV